MAEGIEIDHIANLARVRISEGEKVSLQNDVNEILHYIDILSEVDVSTVEPTFHAVLLKNVWREDICRPTESIKETIIANAPANVEQELIKVPQVIPGEGIS